MIEMRAAIDCMAATVCCTAAPPSRACEAACCAMASVRRALSAFCLIEAVACSSVAEVSSTEAACSEADCDRLCEVLETWVEAASKWALESRTEVMVWVKRSTMARAEAMTRPISSLVRWFMSTVKSPCSRRENTWNAVRMDVLVRRMTKIDSASSRAVPTPDTSRPRRL
ncbi:hypothetical protein GALL_479180 [mine drainage metagenome]|uniref:Uncharacterized protein n=1 Tax=mine drainage metagenome TaxID=410659 RepID=A0A1J5PS99_9ZZZZ